MSKIMLECNSSFHAHLFPNSGGGGHKLSLTPSAFGNNSSSSNGTAAAAAREILFLQEKQGELLRQLHDEIRELKTENSELKFQLYGVLKARNPRHDRKFARKTGEPAPDADAGRHSSMQIAGNNPQTGIGVRKSDGAGLTSQTLLPASDDANQAGSTENVLPACKIQEKKAASIIKRNESPSPTASSPKRLSTTRQQAGHGNAKFHKIRSQDKANTYARAEIVGTDASAKEIGAQLKQIQILSPEDKYGAHLKEGKRSLTSRVSIPNNTTSNYGLSLAQAAFVPRSLSASSRRAQTLRQNSLTLLPSNYKDNVATLPPLVFNQAQGQNQRDSNAAEKLSQNKPWSNAQPGQKFNPSTMTKQKPTGSDGNSLNLSRR